MILTSIPESNRADIDFFSKGNGITIHISLSTPRLLRVSLVFWLLVLFLKKFVSKMALLFAVEVYDMGDVFFCLFKSNIDTYYRKVLALSPSSSITMPKTFFVVLVFFLVCERCLLPTKCIGREDVNGFILLKVPIFLLCWSVPLETLCINLPFA